MSEQIQITSAQRTALTKLAFDGVEVGRDSTFDALWKKGLVSRNGGVFSITEDGLRAIGREFMTPAPRKVS